LIAGSLSYFDNKKLNKEKDISITLLMYTFCICHHARIYLSEKYRAWSVRGRDTMQS